MRASCARGAAETYGLGGRVDDKKTGSSEKPCRICAQENRMIPPGLSPGAPRTPQLSFPVTPAAFKNRTVKVSVRFVAEGDVGFPLLPTRILQ
ncbi:hypothetical protein TREES_T100003938 [Tupaia chinensis]|uniref:Uncharacterized protein n=1 Tax=Tupaia chinensis TaxID=246437 RepID=L9KZN8_TUPCH|nr:hypothetical protein TREES_T100003938 [Tupaia chinensis]